MLHPSYTDLMKVINSEVETGEAPVVNSRYSIVLASAKRARQLIAGADPLIGIRCPKPLSIAVDELYNSKIRILSEEEAAEARQKSLLRKKKKKATMLWKLQMDSAELSQLQSQWISLRLTQSQHFQMRIR